MAFPPPPPPPPRNQYRCVYREKAELPAQGEVLAEGWGGRGGSGLDWALRPAPPPPGAASAAAPGLPAPVGGGVRSGCCRRGWRGTPGLAPGWGPAKAPRFPAAGAVPAAGRRGSPDAGPAAPLLYEQQLISAPRQLPHRRPSPPVSGRQPEATGCAGRARAGPSPRPGRHAGPPRVRLGGRSFRSSCFQRRAARAGRRAPRSPSARPPARPGHRVQGPGGR